MNSEPYAAHVDHLYAAWLKSSQILPSFLDLADALGCNTTRGRDGFPLGSGTSPYPVFEDVIIKTLLSVLDTYKKIPAAYVVERCILAGLLQSDRWKSCLETEKHTYAFAQLVATFSEQVYAHMMTDEWRAMDNNVAVAMNEALAKWLTPGYPIPGCDGYDQRSFAGALFGDVWADVALGSGGTLLAPLIAAHRPPFLRGIHRGQTEQTLENLPNLEMGHA
jgi:hypothetical protein